jgi:hypothetical protein
MSLRKRVLLFGFCLTLIFHLGTALFITQSFMHNKREDLIQFFVRMIQHEHLNLRRTRTDAVDILRAYYKKNLSKTELYAEYINLKIQSIFILKEKYLEPLFNESGTPPVPEFLIRDKSFYSLFHTNQYGQLLFTYNMTDDLKSEMELFKYPHLVTFAKRATEMEFTSKDLQIDMTVIEYDAFYNPTVLYTTLSKDIVGDFLLEIAAKSTEDLNPYMAPYTIEKLSYQAKIIDISNQKYLVLPMTWLNHTLLKQAVYYSVPLKDFRTLDKAPVVILVLTSFIISLGILFAGYYFSDPNQKLDESST